MEFISNTQLVCPAADVLATCQDRLLEKQFVVRVCGAGSTARFVGVHTLEELKQGLANIGLPAILKTARGGYDGKGQVRIDKDTNLEQAWSELKGVPCILEAFVPFIKELSVIVARGYPSDTGNEALLFSGSKLVSDSSPDINIAVQWYAFQQQKTNTRQASYGAVWSKRVLV